MAAVCGFGLCWNKVGSGLVIVFFEIDYELFCRRDACDPMSSFDCFFVGD